MMNKQKAFVCKALRAISMLISLRNYLIVPRSKLPFHYQTPPSLLYEASVHEDLGYKLCDAIVVEGAQCAL